MREVAGKLMYDSLVEMVNPEHTALVVVDMQNDYLDTKGTTAQAGYDVSFIRSCIKPHVGLLDAARKAGVRVVYLQNTVAPDLSTYDGGWLWGNVRERAGMEGPRTALRRTVDGTWGHQIVPELTPKPGEYIVKKNRPTGFMYTNLDQVLRSAHVASVVITGVVTGGCVMATARDAQYLNYYTTVVTDCVGQALKSQHDEALGIMARSHQMTTSEELVALWSELPARKS
jgi:nicotinamidase-related amidase